MRKEKIIAGIDEAGRGPWAGPVVAACVALHKNFNSHSLRDSKKLTSTQREKIYNSIITSCDYGIGIVDNETIDTVGIKKATEKAMNQAYQAMKKKPSFLLVDGNDKFSFPIKHSSIIKGDEKIPVISAASIVAKVWRDKLMHLYHDAYPLYGFDRHKGYGTKDHQKALKKHGITPLHRTSFKPMTKYLLKKPKLLLHICCAVDAGWPIQKLLDTYDITCYFYDPNIHPRHEYLKRKNEMKKILAKFPTVQWVESPYDPKKFFQITKGLENEPEKGKRCTICYDFRLEKTAKYAKQHGYDYFTTTLSTSPHKDIVRIQRSGRKWEHATKTSYLDENFKKNDGYLKTLKIVKDLGIYQQKYCGCIFSLTNNKRRSPLEQLQMV